MSLTYFLPLLLFLSVLAISDARLAKRTVPAPTTLEIPVRLDKNQIYSVMVNMSSNPSPQSFSFALSTATGITTVAGADCDSCGGVPSYNPADSLSVQQLPQTQNVTTLNGIASGTLVREACGLLQSNGSAWSYPNQTVTVASQSASFFSPGVSGIIGIGMAPFADTPAANWLARNPAQPNFSFGMALNPPSNFSSNGGVLHWLQPDQTFYEGDVAWKTMTAANASSPSNMSSWFVEMDAWSVSGSPSAVFNISQSGTELLTFLDPFYASIVFPQSAARAIYADIPGASKHSTSAFAHAWKLPCDSRFRLTVTFGSFSTSLDQSALVVKQADGICVGTIQEWIDAQATEYLLGSPFIAVLYLIFSYSQSGDGSVGVAARAPPRNNMLAPAAIAGVVLGTIAVVALLVIAGVLAYSVWQRAKKPHARKYSKTDITPFPSDISESTSSRHSLRDHYGRSLQNASYNSQAGLLDVTLTPASPDWRTTLLSGETNTFAGGTTFENGSRSSHGHYRTDVPSTSSGLIELDSPPPYAIPHSPPPVPLVPLRKVRRDS